MYKEDVRCRVSLEISNTLGSVSDGLRGCFHPVN